MERTLSLFTKLSPNGRFFRIKETVNNNGRPRILKDGVVLLSIISYSTQYQSLEQCCFRSGIYLGINKTSLRVYLQRFMSLMVEIKDKIIYLPDFIELPDLRFTKNGVHYPFPNTKFAIDGSLIKKNFYKNERTLFIDR